ncbi:calcium uniporter protein 2, mitochondrial-like [Canna indica]|uniref:Calcium uniporter protein 2, mitochondrial-like n=1 Tax=Canna indica TaxID=4628 RepID=A0AAQ3K9I0_9LILI|nr:calcium uniporter protein 2, mitochondrial-like [Canna indica]
MTELEEAGNSATMAFRRALARRFLNTAKPSSSLPSLIPPPRSSSSSSSFSAPSATSLLPKNSFLNYRPVFHRDAPPPERIPLPVDGHEFFDRMPSISPGRIHLEGLSPPLPSPPAEGVSVAQVRKVLRAAQVESVRARLRGLGRSCVSYAEFARICGDVPGVESGAWLARALDESGAVVIFRDVVFLRPEMVAKAIENMIPASLPEAEREELKEMEEKKASIEAKAESLVRREMWCGLGFLALQTAGFMRLTFWELSWDVMEPICFYVTSAYFMFGYAFFLRTSRDPSFEGFFESRFATKQRRLIKTHSFDMERFDQLRKGAAFFSSSLAEPSSSSPPPLPFSHRRDCHHSSTW